MKRTLKAFSVASSLLLAGLPLVAVGGVARAEERVAFGDLNLSTASGAATFESRVEAAAGRFCNSSGERGLAALSECRAGVRQEVAEKLSASQRQALLSARSGVISVASAYQGGGRAAP